MNNLKKVVAKYRRKVSPRRYTLSELLSENYKLRYTINEKSNLYPLVEESIEDVRQNPRDISRLSEQLTVLKYLQSLEDLDEPKRGVKVEDTIFGNMNSKDLVNKEDIDTVEPNKNRALRITPVPVKVSESKTRLSQRKASRSKFMRGKIKESANPDPQDVLTDEELDELMKHLESMRKSGKPIKEEDEILDPVEDVAATEESEESDEPEASVHLIGVDILADGITPVDTEMVEETIKDVLSNAGVAVVGVETETIVSVPEYEEATDTVIDDSCITKKDVDDHTDEDYMYEGLSDFSKKSSSKAFYKTFKKMRESLSTGSTLTRKETFDLYKAANSAMTQLGIELEHNPSFMKKFKESVDHLSVDVSNVLKSICSNRAPSKRTMKSLSRFAESLIREENDKYTEDNYDDLTPRQELIVSKVTDKELSNNDALDEDEAVEYNGDDSATVAQISLDIVVPKETDDPQEFLNKIIKSVNELGYHTASAATGSVLRIQDYADTNSVPLSDILNSCKINEGTEEDIDDDNDTKEDSTEELDDMLRDYADDRKEILDDMVTDYADSEDPEVIKTLEQEAEEVSDVLRDVGSDEADTVVQKVEDEIETAHQDDDKEEPLPELKIYDYKGYTITESKLGKVQVFRRDKLLVAKKSSVKAAKSFIDNI